MRFRMIDQILQVEPGVRLVAKKTLRETRITSKTIFPGSR